MSAYFKCPLCNKWHSTRQIAVIPQTRQNRLGRIAWVRDGVCWECANKAERKKTQGR